MNGSTLVGLVAQWAEKSPEQTAVAMRGHRLTYQELAERAGAVTAGLRDLGVRRGDTVAVLAPRNPMLIPGLLGIMAAGAAYVYLDQRYPDARLAQMISLAATKAAVATSDRAARVSPLPTLLLDRDFAQAAMPCQLDPEDLAYVCFTSGSSGTPKPVGVSHRAITVRTAGPDDIFQLATDSRVLQHLPLSWDVGNFDLWAPLAAGATCVLSDSESFELDALADDIISLQITHLQLPTVLLGLIVTERLAALAQVREVITGGDVASPVLLTQLRKQHPHLRISNAYGPVEATLCASLFELDDETDWQQRVPIGRALHGASIHLLDDELLEVRHGQPGQLYLGGPGLARGYLGMPGKTATRFVPNPYGPGRLYRTGDLGCTRPDGLLDFLGRTDEQVKIRGHRVELGEIEAALLQLPDVHQTGLRVWETDGDRRIAAYIKPSHPGADMDGIRSALARILPAHAIPTWFIAMTQFSLSDHGKILRNALPDPRAGRGGAPEKHGTALAVEQIWAEVLGLAEIADEDDFFDIGGDSIALAKVLNRVRASICSAATIDLLFDHSTMSSLSKALGALSAER